jgi:hypothetical protein
MGRIDGGLRAEFRKHLPNFDWVSIESCTTGGGIPDSNFCYKGIEGWLEFKLTLGHTVPLSPEQIGWILRRVRNGGRVFIAVRQRAPQGPRREARDILWLIPGHGAKLAKQHGLAALIDGVEDHHGGPAQWDWRAIGTQLISSY